MKQLEKTILEMLSTDAMSRSEISDALGLKRNAVCKAMKRLREASPKLIYVDSWLPPPSKTGQQIPRYKAGANDDVQPILKKGALRARRIKEINERAKAKYEEDRIKFRANDNEHCPI